MLLSSFPVAVPPLIAGAPPLQSTPASVSGAGVTTVLLCTRRYPWHAPPWPVSPATSRGMRRCHFRTRRRRCRTGDVAPCAPSISWMCGLDLVVFCSSSTLDRPSVDLRLRLAPAFLVHCVGEVVSRPSQNQRPTTTSSSRARNPNASRWIQRGPLDPRSTVPVHRFHAAALALFPWSLDRPIQDRRPTIVHVDFKI